MTTKRLLPARCRFVTLLAVSLTIVVGCSDRSKAQRKPRTVKGVAKDIDVENRVVSMLFTNKEGRQMPLKGTYTEETEVIINGRSHSIKDIRPGDNVEVTGYSERKGDDVKLVAIKVVIERATDWKPTGQGAATTPSDESSVATNTND